MNKKNIKHSPEWQKEISRLVGQAETVKINKQQTDGTYKEVDEKVTNNIEHYLTEIKTNEDDLAKKETEIQGLKGYTTEYVQLVKRQRDLDDKFTEWKANLATYTKQNNSFLNSGTGITNSYQNKGWNKLISDYNAKQYTSNSKLTDYTNLYESNLVGINGENQVSVKITEQETINLITQWIKVIGQIDATEFKSKLTSSLDYKDQDNNATFDQTKIGTWLDNLQAHAKNLQEMNNDYRVEYKLGHNFANKNQDAMIDPDTFDEDRLTQLFDLTTFLQRNASVWTQDDLKKSFAKIDEQSELTILPAQDKPYTEEKLHEWGVEGYQAEQFKDSKKETNFYGDITGSDKWSQAIKYQVKNGIRGWASLITNFFHTSSSQEKRDKLLSSFTDNPYSTFFNEYRTLNEFDSFVGSDGTSDQNYTLNNFPETLDATDWELIRLEAQKESLKTGLKDGHEELEKSEKEIRKIKDQVKKIKQIIADKITAKITELRTELKTKRGIDKDNYKDFKKNSDTDDNRLTTIEHYELQRMLFNIRFLEHNNEEIKSTIDNENKAYQESNAITLQLASELAIKLWSDIAWTADNETPTIDQKIAVIKEAQEEKYKTWNLNWFYDSFLEREKLVKLSTSEELAKTKLKAMIDNQSPQDNAKDWQNSLQELESGLAIAFDETKIAKWKEKKDGKDAFNNLASIKSLLEKVYDKTGKKVKEDFLTYIKSKDAKLTNLENLIKEKDPKEAIIYILRYEYDKLADTDAKKLAKNNKFGWHKNEDVATYTPTSEELADKADGEFNEFLYDCAIGKIDESKLKRPMEDHQENEPTEDWLRMNNWQVWATFLGIPLIIGAIVGYIYWDNISEWWSDPAKEKEEDDDYNA